MSGFGRGWVAVDEIGGWVPPTSANLHPADAVRLIVSMIEPDGPKLAAVMSGHGWPLYCAPEYKLAAMGAEGQARQRLIEWLRSGELTAWTTEAGDIAAETWHRVDIDRAETWWPLDAPNQGCWWTSKSRLEALVLPIASARRFAAGNSKPISDEQLKTLADQLSVDAGPIGKVGFRDRLVRKASEEGFHLTRARADEQAERLNMRKKQGRSPKTARNIPE